MNGSDITKLSWPLNVALAGTVFAVFAAIDNPYYIYYGFITVLFGVLAHYIDVIGMKIKNEKVQLRLVFGVQGALIVAWVVTLVLIYQLR